MQQTFRRSRWGRLGAAVLLMVGLLLPLNGCGTTQSSVKVQPKSAPVQIRTVTRDSIKVSIINVYPVTYKRNGKPAKAFAAQVLVTALKGKNILAGYSLVMPSLVVDNMGNKYSGTSSAVFDRDMLGRPLPAGAFRLEEQFLPALNSRARTVSLELKLKPLPEELPPTVFTRVRPNQSKQIRDNLYLTAIREDKKAGRLDVSLFQDLKVNPKTVAEIYLLAAGKKYSFSSMEGHQLTAEKPASDYIVSFKDYPRTVDHFDLVVKWLPQEKPELKFGLRNIPFGGTVKP